MVASYSDMPISKIATTGYALIRGVTPIGVTLPRGVTKVRLSPMERPSCVASRVPIAMPPDSSKLSSVPKRTFL